MRARLLLLLISLCSAQASQLVSTVLGLQVTSGENTVTFPFVFDTLSWSTGQFTVGGYTISNITEEFVGSDPLNVIDPLQFRLTGIGSITCDPCTDPLEIDFIMLGILPTDSGFYGDQPLISTTIGIDGSLGEGNDVPADLLLQFPDFSIFDVPMTLTSGQPFSQSVTFGPVSGEIGVIGSFLLGCGCTGLLAPGQVFSAPDSISVTFNTPEPATGSLAGLALAALLLIIRKRS